jgi:hypothetical protein
MKEREWAQEEWGDRESLKEEGEHSRWIEPREGGGHLDDTTIISVLIPTHSAPPHTRPDHWQLASIRPQTTHQYRHPQTTPSPRVGENRDIGLKSGKRYDFYDGVKHCLS